MRILRADERRQRWLAYSRRLCKDSSLVAYYTFESVKNGNATTLPNVSVAGNVLDGQIEGAEWVYGRLPGKYALYFHGPGSKDRVVLPEQERFQFAGPFSVAVWFKVARFAAMYQPLVAKGGASWRVERHENTDFVTFDTNFTAPTSGQSWTVTNGQTGVADGRWHLAVAVYEPVGNVANKRLYIDGHVDAENESPLSLAQNDDPVWLGAHSVTENCEFQGHIDEVAMFARALSGEEVSAMFEAGSPGATVRVGTKK
jgi:hypothetical protein